MGAYTIEKDVIVLNRDFTELDKFVKSFLDVLTKHSDYLVVSGFVSISTGRVRATEDVDILIPIMKENKFKMLFEDLGKNGFWCYQSENWQEVYGYIKEKLDIRFARVNELFPNIELIPISKSNKTKFFEFSHPQKIKLHEFNFKIPPIEFEILYKEIVLGSKKDIADAKHLRTIFSDFIKEENFKKFEPIVRLELE